MISFDFTCSGVDLDASRIDPVRIGAHLNPTPRAVSHPLGKVVSSARRPSGCRPSTHLDVVTSEWLSHRRRTKEML